MKLRAGTESFMVQIHEVHKAVDGVGFCRPFGLCRTFRIDRNTRFVNFTLGSNPPLVNKNFHKRKDLEDQSQDIPNAVFPY